jgi:hypothetical protein
MAEHFPKLIKVKVEVRTITEKAIGFRFPDDPETEPLSWLPLSHSRVTSDWKHKGQLFMRVEIPYWLAQRVGFELGEGA